MGRCTPSAAVTLPRGAHRVLLCQRGLVLLVLLQLPPPVVTLDVNWHGAVSIHAPNATDAVRGSADTVTSTVLAVPPPLCTSKCTLVSVSRHSLGDYYTGSYNLTIGASLQSADLCKSLCLRTGWCVQLTFVASNPAAACVLYAGITSRLVVPTPKVQAWVKCRAGSSVAASCAHFAPPPPAPPPPQPPPPVYIPAQMLRKDFELSSPLAVQATLIVSSTGFVQSFINGKNIAPTERLNPGRSSLNTRQWYSTHNVTEHVRHGLNCLAFLVGRGWQYMEADAAHSAWGGNPAVSAHRATVQALLVITFASQEKRYVATDTTWVTSLGGPIVAHNIYGYEVYDARKGLDICAGGDIGCEILWALPSFQPEPQQQWQQAQVLEQYPDAALSQQVVPPIRQLQLNQAHSVTPVLLSNGTAPLAVHIFDMGQNAAGGVRLAVPANCPSGFRITMFFAEALYTSDGGAPRARVEGPPGQGKAGTVDQTNLYGARARAEYICNGNSAPKHYEPTFTYVPLPEDLSRCIPLPHTAPLQL